jgi:hypothetical protein
MSAHLSTLPRRSRRSLAARGQFWNTFAGIGFSLAFSLLGIGAYLIVEEFANPLGALSTLLLVAALLIATAATLFYCLLYPCAKPRYLHTDLPTAFSEQQTIVITRWNTGTQSRSANDSPARARYVDNLWIRLRS